MVRELKFRQAILNKNGSFREWHYWGFIDGGFVGIATGYVDEALRHSYQYTGYHDKNGEEIYEGDRLREDNGNIWEVFWYKTGLQMKLWGTDKVWFTLADSCELGILEIIGNTYEMEVKC